MAVRQNPWRDLLLDLSVQLDGEVLLFWEMNNGAAFHMLLPRFNDFAEVSLADHLEFPFTYSEIIRLRLERNQRACVPSDETIRRILEIVEAHGEFTLVREGEEIAMELKSWE